MKTLNLKSLIAITSTAIGLTMMQSNAAEAASFSQIINLNPININNPNNPITLNLSAGEYDVSYIGIADGGLYDGWNAWGGIIAGCNNEGNKCQKGWGNSYSISLNNQPANGFGYGNGRFSTLSLARQNSALSNTSFTLINDGTANFFISDSYYADNIGGVSLKVEKVQPVPEPFTTSGILLVGSIGLLLKKKKSPKQQLEAVVKA
ncbi:PEP-CTERM sorting domain-containing protein [Cylindrospermum sp. FACHB-282]|uniref:PEP-CTERM sorting domain-containing protein n=1 Tax=Cylindrospermum sp. FACHB-282 TaxID=2692794 RepID=UPI0016866A79|nr:PEP-CTERM sorting domain-containing protein [Cylindrospermum sp. FACHB-282]MBD2387795.1 PEP-CTERM sorting domain-containing protein [Cylindrospermum sp. FACHB-282]